MKSTWILDKDLPLNIPCPGLRASICLKGGWWWHIYEECWGRTWKCDMIAEMKLSSSLSSKCSTDVGMGNHLEKEKKKCVHFWEQRCMWWQFRFLPRDAGIFLWGRFFCFQQCSCCIPCSLLLTLLLHPLPICLPLCLAYPTPGFFLSLSSFVGYFPLVTKWILS